MSTSRPKTRAQAKAAQRASRGGAGTAQRGSSTGGGAGGAKGGGAKGGGSKGGRRKKWLKGLGITALVGFLLAVVAFFLAYSLIDTPKPNDLANAQASIIYYADGKTEMDRISEVNRESVKLSQVPKPVQQAHLAAEDRNFYQNSGISPTGIARAVWVGLRGGATQGGSTITQQYVKNYFLTQDQTLSRKGREIIISIKIAKQESKDQILENYLNTIYYGRGAYGIQTASKAYFNKDVSKLTPSEGAFLASVIRAPSLYDPGLGAEQKANAESRWKYVMDGMVTEGWLTPEQRAAAKFPTLQKPRKTTGATGPTGYLVDQVKRELKSKLKLTDADIDKGGYKIVSTIDKRTQDAAVAAVKDRMPTGKGTSTLRAGLTSIKPGDGAIVALYGGADYQKNQFNTATQATMQAGSTFKVFALLAGLSQDKPISTHTKFDGRSPQYFKEFEDSAAKTDFLRRGGVANFGGGAGEQFGNIDLREATGHSVNTVYAQLNIKVGPEATKAAAIAAGLPSDAQAKARKIEPLGTNYANVLGTSHVTVLDMANAYATIAAQGTRATPYIIRTVKGGPGDLDYKVKPVKKAAFDKDVMADTIDAMEQVVKSGTATYAQNLGRPAAGKTGTTTDNKAAWFDGYTPQLATAVGIYSTGKNGEELSMNNVPGVGELTGATVPLRIWTDFMEAALKGQKVVDFPKRVGLGDDQVFTPPPTTTSSSTTTTTTTTTTTAPPTTTPPTTTKTTGKPTKTTTAPEPPTITLGGAPATTTAQPQ
ncbi:Membrane carboxypeptidase (penicillin-binding protein) [Pedococcus dokdonensis]|uniref:Membrane carboxypeptidase (Penicillin-binding protein) n=1 Tax=Pedococcus dokdonensis TaxID=443156 RepID=A0A1H0TGV5_9MICO|nr:transglycosylase domain-containing protein [Pedococcus dokdonensis]SDP52920.1 Membrane carboxypeptidase (penicillin-binding protein) [Pedococcus dokdonensis]